MEQTKKDVQFVIQMKYHCGIETKFLPYDQSMNLPSIHLPNSKEIQAAVAEVHHTGVLKEKYINGTSLQMELLRWHFSFCQKVLIHINNASMGLLWSTSLVKAAANCKISKCASCEYAKAK